MNVCNPLINHPLNLLKQIDISKYAIYSFCAHRWFGTDLLDWCFDLNMRMEYREIPRDSEHVFLIVVNYEW